MPDLTPEERAAEIARPMRDAPKDGTPVLVKMKDDLSEFGVPNDGEWHRMRGFLGIYAVMRSRGDPMDWCFAAPVGMGGFPDEWLEGWWPLPAAQRAERAAPDFGTPEFDALVEAATAWAETMAEQYDEMMPSGGLTEAIVWGAIRTLRGEPAQPKEMGAEKDARIAGLEALLWRAERIIRVDDIADPETQIAADDMDDWLVEARAALRAALTPAPEETNDAE